MASRVKVTEKDREAARVVFSHIVKVAKGGIVAGPWWGEARDAIILMLAARDAAAYRRGLEDAAKVADAYTGKPTVGAAIRKLGEDA